MKLHVKDDFIQAVSNQNVDLVEEFLAEGVTLSVNSISVSNALTVACSTGCFKMVELLVNNGASVVSLNDVNSPILALCSSTNKNEDELLRCLDLLISGGADMDSCDSFNCSALSLAVKYNHEKIIMKLLNEGADLNKVDLDGWSPIFYAVILNNIYLVSLLKDYGADIYLMDYWGRSLVDLALDIGNSEIVLLLNKSHELAKWYDHLPNEKVKYCGMYEMILSKLPCVQDRLSGFEHDGYNILNAIQLGHLSRKLREYNVGFGHLLTMNDAKLKEIGIHFEFERRKLLSSIRKFHEHPWSTSSLVASNIRELDLKIMQLIITITRQLYIISVSSYWWTKLGGIEHRLSPLPMTMNNSLKTIRTLKNTIKDIKIFFMRRSRMNSSIPSDLIVSHEIDNKPTIRSILVKVIFCGICLYMTNMHSKFF